MSKDDEKEPLVTFRDHLVLARQKSQETYDKSLFTLSSGALGLSMAFIDKLIGSSAPKSPGFLLGAWGAWILSLLLILFSHFFSQRALTDAILALDRDEDDSPESKEIRRTVFCNVSAGIALVVGAVCMILFVFINIVR